MQDDHLNEAGSAARPVRRGKTTLIIAFLAFAIGAGLAAWLFAFSSVDIAGWSPRKSTYDESRVDTATAPPAELAASAPPPASPQPFAAPSGPVETRLALLEERLSRIDLQTEITTGNARRTESLLIAFATRRMIDRGQALGYLEDQLRVRFADSQPNAVQTLLAAGKEPVTIDRLAAELEAMEPKLTAAPSDEGAWSWLKREVAGLVVIRNAETPSKAPENRIGRARLMLAAGKVEAAIAEVERMPGAAGASSWIGDARRYVAAQQALDLIETSAMLQPDPANEDAAQDTVYASPDLAPRLPANPPEPTPEAPAPAI